MSSLPNSSSEWPEAIQRVQSLAESPVCLEVPSRYIRPTCERPQADNSDRERLANVLQIPIIDLNLLEYSDARKEEMLRAIHHACSEWGCFYLINHAIPQSLLQRTAMVGKQFFQLPLEEKEKYANDPTTYEGYGSRVGIDKGAILDWGDYYYLNYLPVLMRNLNKWPVKPLLWRETMEEYCQHVLGLSAKLLEAFSCNLGLASNSALNEIFGGETGLEIALRVNYYPPCPQPDLTLGLCPHSDPGGFTVLLQDQVEGLQVRHKETWVSVTPSPGALLVNIGDQIQILTNDKYQSVEHRVLVNSERERLSVACFINPGNDQMLAPLEELIDENNPPLYNAMTYRRYRSFIRTRGNKGKGHVDAIRSPT